jgi:translation initiation factor 1
MCEEIAREQQRIKIYSDRRRYGKVVTIVEGIDAADIDVEDLAKRLKTKCAAGGTVKDGRIELQGEHRKKVKLALEDIGFTVEVR